MATSTLSERVRFGVFEADLRSGELRKQGVKIKLHKQPFQILTLLLERPGEVVTREELQRRLWPSDTFVDFDLGLNSAVRKLRDALGDSAETPRYIETLPRRGCTWRIDTVAVKRSDPRNTLRLGTETSNDSLEVLPRLTGYRNQNESLTNQVAKTLSGCEINDLDGCIHSPSAIRPSHVTRHRTLARIHFSLVPHASESAIRKPRSSAATRSPEAQAS